MRWSASRVRKEGHLRADATDLPYTSRAGEIFRNAGKDKERSQPLHHRLHQRWVSNRALRRITFVFNGPALRGPSLEHHSNDIVTFIDAGGSK